jgi:hypothetical protein
MNAFEDGARRNFEEEMVRHVKQFTPKHAELLGEGGTRSVVQFAMDRASRHGFTMRGPCRLYIDFVFMFGSDFDTDPQFPWAGAILSDAGTPDQMAKAERLHQESIAYVDAVAGPNYEYSINAFKRARRVSYEDLARPIADLESSSVAGFRAIFPEKYAYVGDSALRQLTREAVEKARMHSVSSQAGILVFAFLMFALGHGFAADPHHPWIASTLAQPPAGDPNRRAERLHSKAMIYLDRVLANVG